MSGRLTDEQVAWYAGTSRTAKWTADMAVHENIVTLAREVQAHRSSCECAPLAEYPHEMWCPSIDVCAICADSECDGIGCISVTEPIWIECEGSNLVGHAVMGDGQPLVMCQMCGQTYIPAGVYGSVPDHDRQDILAMIDRGDFAP